MHGMLNGKNILIVEGSLIATAELQEALHQEGARPFLAHNLAAAFELVQRIRLDAAVIDQGLHNEAFDLCAELQAADIPYISCTAPHRLQGWMARKRDAEHAVWKLGHVLSRVDAIAADRVPAEEVQHELRSY
jgi:DNA-binding response OmpR family regulator